MALAQSLINFQSGLLAEMQLGLLLLQVLLILSSLFLIMLVLVQRGKGGGLTGALGGMGGQSAFGSKAGDAFTKITIITAAIWILLCMVTIAYFNPPPRGASAGKDKAPSMTSADPEDTKTTESTITPGDATKSGDSADGGADATKTGTDDGATDAGATDADATDADAGAAVEGLGEGVEVDLGGSEPSEATKSGESTDESKGN